MISMALLEQLNDLQKLSHISKFQIAKATTALC